MNESQMAKVTDLYEVEAYGHSIETALIDAKNQYSIHIEELREITGTTVQNPDLLMEEKFPPMNRPADDWVEEALASNPLLLSLQYAAEASQQMIQSARAGHLPTASLLASDIFSNTLYNNTQTNGLDSYNIASVYLNVNIPIYAGGGVEAQSRESVQRYQISREKVEEVRRSIEKDIRSDWYNIETGSNRIASTKKEAEFRLKAKTAQTTSYTLGTATIVEVLDAHKRLLKAETEFHKARYDYIRSLIRLRLHSGSLADFDLEEISVWFKPRLPKIETANTAPLPREINTDQVETQKVSTTRPIAPPETPSTAPSLAQGDGILQAPLGDDSSGPKGPSIAIRQATLVNGTYRIMHPGGAIAPSAEPNTKIISAAGTENIIATQSDSFRSHPPRLVAENPASAHQLNHQSTLSTHEETRKVMKSIAESLEEIDSVLK